MQAVIFSFGLTWTLEKAIVKPENKTIYNTNNHLWRLKFTEYCLQELKKTKLL